MSKVSKFLCTCSFMCIPCSSPGVRYELLQCTKMLVSAAFCMMTFSVMLDVYEESSSVAIQNGKRVLFFQCQDGPIRELLLRQRNSCALEDGFCISQISW